MVISVVGMAVCCLLLRYPEGAADGRSCRWGCGEGGKAFSKDAQEERKMAGQERKWEIQAEVLTPEERLLDRGQAMPEDDAQRYFYASEIPEEVFARMEGVSYVENEDVALEELRYLCLLYRGFDGETHVGEMVVHESISEAVLAIFQSLYENGYPIEKIRLVDDYGGDDEASMRDNNTSAFNYRRITGSGTLSRHALGLAIDINPLYNPYVENPDGEGYVSPAEGEPYVKREVGQPYQIGGEGDLCLQLFKEWGFEWGGDWTAPKDYQHFEMRR